MKNYAHPSWRDASFYSENYVRPSVMKSRLSRDSRYWTPHLAGRMPSTRWYRRAEQRQQLLLVSMKQSISIPPHTAPTPIPIPYPPPTRRATTTTMIKCLSHPKTSGAMGLSLCVFGKHEATHPQPIPPHPALPQPPIPNPYPLPPPTPTQPTSRAMGLSIRVWDKSLLVSFVIIIFIVCSSTFWADNIEHLTGPFMLNFSLILNLNIYLMRQKQFSR